ncbi:MAG: M28 family peptidase [Proteobacteria bacterium]|nr:M28 family peptidase [Pseudomonadota bacterium]
MMHTAHWDHPASASRMPNDAIFNGAVDNAAGVAQLLEIAPSEGVPRTERSLGFLFVGAEEQGAWVREYATHPLYPSRQRGQPSSPIRCDPHHRHTTS